MPWEPKMGECVTCGKPILRTSPKQKYCSECRELAKQRDRRKDKAKRKAKQVAEKRGTDPDRFVGKETECKFKDICYYGAQDYCNYIGIEGHSRIMAGYHIKDGKCDAFREDPKPGSKMKLPAPGGWTYGDMLNV